MFKSLLDKCLSGSLIRVQDQTQILEDIASNALTRKLAFDYLESNWNQLNEKFGSVIYTLPNMVNLIINKFNSKEDFEKVKNFTIKYKNKMGIAKRAFEEGLDNIKTNMEWMDKNFKSITKWLLKTVKTDDLNEPKLNYRLSRYLKPYNYNLFLESFFKSTTMPDYYNAKVKIDFTCIKNTNELLLNMKDLELNNNTLLLESTSDTNFISLKRFSYSYNNRTQLFSVDFNNKLFKTGHNYSFHAEFKGFFKDDNIGLFRSSYLDYSDYNKRLIFKRIKFF